MIEGRPRESLVQYENPIEVIFISSQLNFILDLSRIRSKRSIQEDLRM
jgi:hypothetical protein